MQGEEQYMLWLGKEQVVFGKPGSNITAMAVLVLQEMDAGRQQE